MRLCPCLTQLMQQGDMLCCWRSYGSDSCTRTEARALPDLHAVLGRQLGALQHSYAGMGLGWGRRPRWQGYMRAYLSAHLWTIGKVSNNKRPQLTAFHPTIISPTATQAQSEHNCTSLQAQHTCSSTTSVLQHANHTSCWSPITKPLVRMNSAN